MTSNTDSPRRGRLAAALTFVATMTALVSAATIQAPAETQTPVDAKQVLHGRELVIEHACGACHGGPDPDSPTWLAGVTAPDQEFLIGPCVFQEGATPCFRTRPRNLTPDNLTGLGRFTQRQIFNALRYGLRPGETGDVEITSTTPGQGNFPEHPKYLAPPMPWTAWRHMPDADIWAIAAYLKHGIKPVRNRVADSEGPPDFWAADYTAIGPFPAPPFPTTNEIAPDPDEIDMKLVRRGRQVVIQHDCGACHGGGDNPAADGWLAGATAPEDAFPVGACALQPGASPCFTMRPRNLTPDPETGLGRFSDRQIFNALRFGLRPEDTPDVAISSTTPGHGNFPSKPRYLGLGMPWPAWRHMSDHDLRAVIAYLRHGVKPVVNLVQPSDAPPDSWASEYTIEKIGAFPAPPFPAANEVKR